MSIRKKLSIKKRIPLWIALILILLGVSAALALPFTFIAKNSVGLHIHVIEPFGP